MKHKNATLDDVARHAGVSYQTVSRVLNGSAHVADATRARVNEAIRTLNYVPNRMAQQLAGKRGCTLGLITASLGFHAPSQIASAIKGVAGQRGFSVLIAMADPQHEIGLQDALNELKAQRVERVIINLPLAAESAAAIVADNSELVCLFLDVPTDAGVFHVMFNPGDGTRASVDHLYRLGHRHFALLAGPQDSVSARLRLDSWRLPSIICTRWRQLRATGAPPVVFAVWSRCSRRRRHSAPYWSPTIRWPSVRLARCISSRWRCRSTFR
ncbi:Lactose operon repressor [Sodalis glossinidius str. 'morsitans']|uniref:Lactose operon repressor n=1 Tax=Sodalis glossinidius (strain morsitans) TaxID=343509 RepID=Q2NS48_SODGM|nr:putative lactose operon repressor [Sodalis glossinidius str. 'morsitans']CRL45930.1 Lactose operon repressor [Sodalis glossinidius str. 'morsitans']